MNAPRVSLSFSPSLCQHFHSRWKFDKVLTKTILQFFRHGAVANSIHTGRRRDSSQISVDDSMDHTHHSLSIRRKLSLTSQK